jgi:hypothetical protein
MSLEFLKGLNDDKMNVANLDSDIGSFMETDNQMATASQTVCPDENVKI